ncbi:MAG: hypothetical protein M3O20_16680 [Acidobacteriota bacterium]|nr:hypothetical protein [Acidobacteriota bacterium]
MQPIESLVLLTAGRQTWVYVYLYWGAQTLNIFLALYVVQDLFHIILAEHAAIASFGRRIMLGAMALAGGIAVAGITLDARVLPGHFHTVQRFATFERSMNSVILIFLLLISILLLWFPIKVRKNIAVYFAGFVLFAASRSFGLLLANLLPQSAVYTVSTVLLGLTLLCLLFWTMGIRPEGEDFTTTPGHRRDPQASERLSRKLDAINATLARVVRH